MGSLAQMVGDLSFINAVLAIIVSAGAGFAVLWPKVRDGVIVKLGLCTVSLAQFASGFMLIDGTIEGDTVGLLRANMCSCVGLLIIGAGLLWRYTETHARISHFFASVQQKRRHW